MKGVIGMYDHKWKKAGVAISAVGLLLMAVERIKGFIFFGKMNVAQHYLLFECIMLAGLYLIIYCREEFDDERTKQIRLKSYQLAFGVLISTMLAISFTAVTHNDMQMGPEVLLLLTSMGTMLYLIVFHIGLYFDFLWDYNDRGVWENLKNIDKNKWGLLVYLAACAVMFIFIALMTAI